jgi:UDP-N-acetylglucosamine acyltransferase
MKMKKTSLQGSAATVNQCQMIHPTAIIDPQAQIDPTTRVGPYAVIDAGVQVGPHCLIGPHVYLTGQTSIGSHNRFFCGCVIGEAPQDLKYRGDPTSLRIGDHNTFRENATVNRSSIAGEETVIGSHNYLMAQSHVAHNSRIENHAILANGALLAGHVLVQDRAIISGNCLVHQFVRVGTLAIMQGGSAISKDLPPFTVARGHNGMCGLNTVGLRRAGFTPAQRLELKKLYRILFRSGLSLLEAVEVAQREFQSEIARQMIDFVAVAKRGFPRDTGSTAQAEDDEP